MSVLGASSTRTERPRARARTGPRRPAACRRVSPANVQGPVRGLTQPVSSIVHHSRPVQQHYRSVSEETLFSGNSLPAVCFLRVSHVPRIHSSPFLIPTLHSNPFKGLPHKYINKILKLISKIQSITYILYLDAYLSKFITALLSYLKKYLYRFIILLNITVLFQQITYLVL